VLLENKTAIVYGAAGSIGSSVARAYAREGASVHLAGRTHANLEAIATSIRSAGGAAHVAQLDVLDADAVRRHAASVVDTSGGIDVCFNATSNDDIQGKTLLDMPVDELMQPVTKALTAHYRIVTAVAPHMATRGGGVILVMAGGREAIPRLGGSHVAWAALAGLCRQLAADLGPSGIRVAWLLSPGSPGVAADGAAVEPTDHRAHDAPAGTVGLIPRHQPSLEEVAGVATVLASDFARTMTATEINLTGGAVPD
jgi:NAD(P)-dependent dehydrogenase (short-subunit alcohol dehydrogenase family)